MENENILESCISGRCEGKCRELYYEICGCHQKYYKDIDGKRVYLPPTEINWKEIDANKKVYTKTDNYKNAK
jgi:hypothetical protein